MAASKSTKSNSRKPASKGRGTSSGRKKSQQSDGFQTEIILLVILAASVIFLVSNFGLGGVVGNTISGVCFGIMGIMAYIFPIILFVGSAFLLSNRSNSTAVKKSIAAVVLFLFLCGFLHLVTGSFVADNSLMDYYQESSVYHTGGGVIGGAICISVTSAFGTVGGCIILVMVLLVCLIVITQKSFFGFLYRLWDAIVGLVQGQKERYQEGQPERDLKKELRTQQKQKAREERRAERMRKLEEAIAAEEAELSENKDGDSSADRRKSERDASGRRNSGRRDSDRRNAGRNRSRREIAESDSRRSRRRSLDGTRQNLAGFLEGTTLKESSGEDVPMEEFMDHPTANTEKGDSLAIDSTLSGGGQMEFSIHRAESSAEPEEESSGFVPNYESPVQGENGNSAGRRETSSDFSELPKSISNESFSTGEVFSGGSGMEEYGSHSAGSGMEEYGSHSAMEEYGSRSAGSAMENYGSNSAGSAGEASGDIAPETPQDIPAPRQSVKNPKSSKKEIESGIVNIQHEISTQEAAVKKEYQVPPLKLLKRGDGKSQGDSDAHLRKTAQKLHDTLANFGVNVTVTNVSCGPTVTRYELAPEQGVKVSKIVGLADDIKLNLAAADIRIEAPIPGKAAVGIEVPNKEASTVMLRELIQSQEFQGAKSKLSFAVGKDIAGKPVVANIAKMPHLLIAGATGSGKSVCINTLIISILYKAGPEDVRLIMIDPKVVELSVYNGIPHLLIPVVTDPKKAAGALNWAVTEMTNRYNAFAEYGVRNLEEYNRKIAGMTPEEGQTAPEKMPQIVIIVDELADLMMVAPGEVEDAICRLAQLARAAGIHLIIATQRPSVNVITGLIKANMPSRIAFSVSSGVDSRTILDMNGAEKLLGKGDMLFYPQGYTKPARLQGAFVSDEEVESIVNFLADKNPGVQYSSQIEEQLKGGGLGGAGGSSEERDVYFEEAGKFIIEKDKASIGMLQRMFKIGFNRAARIMDQLADAGVVGPEEGTKPRKILMSEEQFEQYVEEYL